MTGGMVTTIIVAVLSGGGLTALVTWRHQKRREPIERDEAASAQTMSHVEAADRLMARALAIAEAADRRSKVVHDKLTVLDQKVAEQGNEISRLRQALAAARQSVTILLTAWRQNWPDTPIPPLPLDNHNDI